jgi:AraC-like DNA-binding protein
MHYTDEQITDLYDSNPNLTLAQLSRMTGKSVEQLKRILMPE